MKGCIWDVETVGPLLWGRWIKRDQLFPRPYAAIQSVLQAGQCVAIWIQLCAHKGSATCSLFSDVKWNIIKLKMLNFYIFARLHLIFFFFYITHDASFIGWWVAKGVLKVDYFPILSLCAKSMAGDLVFGDWQ